MNVTACILVAVLCQPTAPAYHLPADAGPELSSAATHWNNQHSDPVITPSAPATIRVTNAPLGDTTGAYAGHDWYAPLNPAGACSITVNSDMSFSRSVLTRVLAHELGHCLGVKHQAGGVMAPGGIAGARLAA